MKMLGKIFFSLRFEGAPLFLAKFKFQKKELYLTFSNSTAPNKTYKESLLR